MSPNNPNDFIGSLVEMAKAYEQLPRVEADLAKANDSIESYAAQVQRLEIKLMDRASEVESLNSRIRSLEVERDDAQFHALEADDRTQRALDFIKATFGNAGSLIQALDPPKAITPTPDVSVQAVPEATAASEAMTSPGDLPHPADPTPDAYASSFSHDAPSVPEVAAQPDPTPADAALTEALFAPATATAPDTDTSTPSVPPNAYAGRTYSEVAKTGHWPTRDEWHAGGGTLDNWYA